MSTKINIHNIVEVREQITHYTNNLKFICRTITVLDADNNETEICFFTHDDERSIVPLTTKRSYHNA